MTSPLSKSLRQGLPRIPGGDPWPPASVQKTATEPTVLPVETEIPVAKETTQVVPTPEPETSSVQPAIVSTAPVAKLRQGLPRVVGGDPWPPGETPGSATVPLAAAEPAVAPESPAQSAPVQEPASLVAPESAGETEPAQEERPVEINGDAPAIRRGLPRVADGQPWPPASFVAAPFTAAPVPAEKAEQRPSAEAQEPVVAAPVIATPVLAEPEVKKQQVAEPVATPVAAPAPASAPAPNTPLATTSSKPAAAEPKRHGPLTTKQWILAVVLGAFCALGMATAVVLVARGIAGIDAVAAFIQRYPGEYHLPESAPVGVPAWLAWNHFFNFFLMVLIIRSGLQVRHQKKPPAYWSSKRSPKVSINLWLHQSLDVLWIINGLVFVVLLFASGHWMRIVPTSWEVVPNALSAALQYLTLDWPTENGWVNYNSLQQLAYFITVFVAAPLAAITGFRLSAFWPKAPSLSKKYPIEVARALHFPTMLYFAVFILVHVILVFSTGALRNLNHMYAAQGSTDPTQYAENWAGLLYFALSLLVITAAWFACRPIVLSSIAGFFGKVSSR
ncbi:cytochrome b/b6 domain-containing protein [Glutamicibacter ectropisis]|uniref:Cytochrome b/b6 domain-containing protein n=1 Tax=Glutamicibacter ectropisis TaxID=3046593 RepID=A0AAU6WDR9_9MICC